jgi:hypothetical protein
VICLTLTAVMRLMLTEWMQKKNISTIINHWLAVFERI